MQPAMRADIPVRVKNSYNEAAPGTLITAQRREESEGSPLVTAITSKSRVALVDIESTRMLGAYSFLARARPRCVPDHLTSPRHLTSSRSHLP